MSAPSTAPPASGPVATARPVRVALVGAGLIGRAHLDVMRRTPGLELAGVADPGGSAAALAHDHGTRAYAGLEALLQAEQPDAVVLATPNALHVPQALQCLDAGAAVLIEKPVATSVAEGLTLMRRVESGGPPALVGHHRAHSPIMASACQWIREGHAGSVVAISGRATFFKPAAYFEQGAWRREPGGGPILINLIHDIHNLRMLAGDIVAVQAMASRATRRFAVEDTVAISLQFAQGALGTFLLSDTAASTQSWEQTSGENPAYARDPRHDCYHVSGTRGSIAVPSLHWQAAPPDTEPSWMLPLHGGQLAVAPQDPLLLQMHHFVAVVRRQETPRVSVRDGLENLRVTEAIAEAARSGCRVSLPPLV